MRSSLPQCAVSAGPTRPRADRSRRTKPCPTRRRSVKVKSQEFLGDAEEGAVTFITGAALIDGCGGAPLQDAVVVIRGRHVKQVGTRAEVEVPAGANVLDAAGCTLMPGMMDLHI